MGPSLQRVARATTVQGGRGDIGRENQGDARNRPAGPSGAAAEEEEEEDDQGACPIRCAATY